MSLVAYYRRSKSSINTQHIRHRWEYSVQLLHSDFPAWIRTVRKAVTIECTVGELKWRSTHSCGRGDRMLHTHTHTHAHAGSDRDRGGRVRPTGATVSLV